MKRVSIERFKTVIFDFDGVIIDSEGVQLRAWRAVAEELGVAGGVVTLGRIAGKLDRHIAPELLPGHDPVHCVTRKKNIQAEMEVEGISYIEETLKLTERIGESHRLAICSSSLEGKILEILEKREIAGRFEVIVGQVEGEECKPSPGPYLKVLRLMGIEAGEACVIEDSPTGIRAAKGAGLFTIQLLHEGMEVNALADAAVRSAGEIG